MVSPYSIYHVILCLRFGNELFDFILSIYHICHFEKKLVGILSICYIGPFFFCSIGSDMTDPNQYLIGLIGGVRLNAQLNIDTIFISNKSNPLISLGIKNQI